MNIAVLGTGMVGATIGSKLVQKGHQVMMGSRTADNEKSIAWKGSAGQGASSGTFADAAAFGEIIFNCTSGSGAIPALNLAGDDNLRGKIVIDIANPLDFSNGFPPTMSICNTDSLGEQIQKAFPDAKVVKALNTMACAVMVEPSLVPGDHNVIICGNDDGAKKEVTSLIGDWFGWKEGNVIDLGDITASRGTEMVLPLWVRLYGAFQNPIFNFHIAVGANPQG